MFFIQLFHFFILRNIRYKIIYLHALILIGPITFHIFKSKFKNLNV